MPRHERFPARGHFPKVVRLCVIALPRLYQREYHMGSSLSSTFLSHAKNAQLEVLGEPLQRLPGVKLMRYMLAKRALTTETVFPETSGFPQNQFHRSHLLFSAGTVPARAGT